MLCLNPKHILSELNLRKIKIIVESLDEYILYLKLKLIIFLITITITYQRANFYSYVYLIFLKPNS